MALLRQPQSMQASEQRSSQLGPQGRVSKPPAGDRRSPAVKAALSRPAYLPSSSLKDVGCGNNRTVSHSGHAA